ncbi:MAG TPA: CBS domain-containing protein, partial [Thermomicrobiales bacterium]|nr:CBS domain-containing protein [Thermomicrobiales bacterium]
FVRELMRVDVVALAGSMTVDELRSGSEIHGDRPSLGQGLYPVVDTDQRLIGVVTRHDLQRIQADPLAGHETLAELCDADSVVAFPDEPLRYVIERMASTGLTRMPVVNPLDNQHLVGLISLTDLLRARQRTLDEERVRERVLTIRMPGGPPSRSSKGPRTIGREPIAPFPTAAERAKHHNGNHRSPDGTARTGQPVTEPAIPPK